MSPELLANSLTYIAEVATSELSSGGTTVHTSAAMPVPLRGGDVRLKIGEGADTEICRVTATGSSGASPWTIERNVETVVGGSGAVAHPIGTKISAELTAGGATKLKEEAEASSIPRLAPTFTPEEFGCVPNDGSTTGTDCSADYETMLVDAKAQAETEGFQEATILHRGLTYWFTRNPVEKSSGTTKWLAQVAIPEQNPDSRKFRFNFIGTGALTFAHWDQTEAQTQGGTILRSTLTGRSEVGSWGIPSMLGGPTFYEESTLASFTNVLVHMDGITVMAPLNPGVFIGVDLRMISQFTFGEIAAMVPKTPTEMLASLPTTEAYGFYPPIAGNNAVVQGESIFCEGWYYPIVLTEHMRINTLGAVYVGWGMLYAAAIADPGEFPSYNATDNQHSCIIVQATVEAAAKGLIKVAGNGDNSSGMPIFMTADIESIGEEAETIKDPENCLMGLINLRVPSGFTVGVEGGARVQVNEYKARNTPILTIPGSVRVAEPTEDSNPVTKKWLEENGVAGSAEFYESHAWSVLAPEATGVYGGIKINLLGAETGHLVRADYKIASGTKIKGKILKNGTLATGFEFEATGTEGHVEPTAVSITSGEKLQLELTELSGSPKGLEVTATVKKVTA